MELQCGCTIDETDVILLDECKPHKEGKFMEDTHLPDPGLLIMYSWIIS